MHETLYLIFLTTLGFTIVYAGFYKLKLDIFNWKRYPNWSRLIVGASLVSQLSTGLICFLYLFRLIPSIIAMAMSISGLAIMFISWGMWWMLKYNELSPTDEISFRKILKKFILKLLGRYE